MRSRAPELVKYVVNGLAATVVHYGVLTLNLQFLGMQSAALASTLASAVAITFSYFGNRFFVFKSASSQILGQFFKFFWIYSLIALIHGTVLFVTTDWLGYDYRIGFLLAVCIQVVFGYVGNKKLVF